MLCSMSQTAGATLTAIRFFFGSVFVNALPPKGWQGDPGKAGFCGDLESCKPKMFEDSELPQGFFPMPPTYRIVYLNVSLQCSSVSSAVVGSMT